MQAAGEIKALPSVLNMRLYRKLYLALPKTFPPFSLIPDSFGRHFAMNTPTFPFAFCRTVEALRRRRQVAKPCRVSICSKATTVRKRFIALSEKTFMSATVSDKLYKSLLL